jgi:hypothetical protein
MSENNFQFLIQGILSENFISAVPDSSAGRDNAQNTLRKHLIKKALQKSHKQF